MFQRNTEGTENPEGHRALRLGPMSCLGPRSGFARNRIVMDGGSNERCAERRL